MDHNIYSLGVLNLFIIALSSNCYDVTTYTVATIGMATATLTKMESAVSIQVCTVLINSMQLEISLTAFIETSPVTATGL